MHIYKIDKKTHISKPTQQNKLALSPFNSKIFLVFDGTSTSKKNVFRGKIGQDGQNKNKKSDNISLNFQLLD